MRKRKSDTLKCSAMLGVVMLSCVFPACVYGGKASELNWPEVKQEHKPWTYWWWPGSAVDKEGLTEHLEAYGKAGLGGVHIIPIYGVRGAEEQFIDYLSPKWMAMLAHTTSEAKRLGMGVDMSTGTGWPFGGPNVGVGDATAEVIFQTYTVSGGERLNERVRLEDEKAELQALMGFSERGETVELTAKVDGEGNVDWAAPAGSKLEEVLRNQLC